MDVAENQLHSSESCQSGNHIEKWRLLIF